MPRILIIKLGALGDVIMATSLVRQIRAHHREDQVTLLTSDHWDGLFENQDLFELAVFPRAGLRNTVKTLAWIRSRRFLRIYDLQSSDRSGLYCALSGAPERVGNHPRFPYTRHPVAPYLGKGHIYDRMIEVLQSAGIAAQAQPPWLPVDAAGVDHVRAWLAARVPHGEAPALLHATASPRHPQKRWPGFPVLAQELSRSGVPVVWIGSRADRMINAELARAGGIDASGEFSLPELAELGRHARFAVTNDSAPMHVLSAGAIPVYGLFGPTDWRRTHAFGQRDRVISPQPEQGTFVPAPMSAITLEQVLDRLRCDGLIPG